MVRKRSIKLSLSSRIEGIGKLGDILGLYLSKHIFKSFGPIGVYTVFGILLGSALAYTIWFVSDPEKQHVETTNSSLDLPGVNSRQSSYISKLTFVFRAIKITFMGFKSILTRERPLILKALIGIIYFNYGLFFIGYNVASQVRIFVKKHFSFLLKFV